MKSESEPNASDRRAGQALVAAYLILIILFSLMQIVAAYGQGSNFIRGRVTDEQGQGLIGALVRIKGSAYGTSTGKEGEFSLREVAASDTLIVSYLGFHSKEVLPGNSQQPFTIVLKANTTALQEVEVLSTGYQEIPKERATGSFVQIDQQLLDRRVSTNILDRLDGVTSGLIFNTNNNRQYRQSDIQIRGRATLFANADPLIVVDNFPYDGDISNINPGDVQSITVLKDAAAASAWGARAGNGVIVITTKKGKLNAPAQLSFNSNVTMGAKPDLYYTPQLSSAQYIGIEQFLFNQGAYDARINTGFEPLSPAVEIFRKTRSGELSPADSMRAIQQLEGYDVRRQQTEYLYQTSVNQQYQTSISGGGQQQKYFVSAGYDANRSSQVANRYERFNLNASNTYYFLDKRLELFTNFFYTNSRSQTVPQFSANLPYDQLADDAGMPLPVARNLRLEYARSAGDGRLLNWMYVPLEELRAGYSKTRGQANDYRLNMSLGYSLSKDLKASALYSYEKGAQDRYTFHASESFYARNLINTYTQLDAATGELSYGIPMGAIRSQSSADSRSYNARLQLNYSHEWDAHAVHALGGAEIKEYRNTLGSLNLYGYNPETATNQNAAINYAVEYPWFYGYNTSRVSTGISQSGNTDRFLSYYANASYTYKRRYVLSLSARRDESNLFGVKSNQKGVPLWSAGLSWDLAGEGFYDWKALPQLRLRATYGFTGNVDRSLSAYLTARAGTLSQIYNSYYTEIVNPPNPSLRWEKVENVNAGVDFGTRNNRLSGSLEYWRKKGLDLIGNSPIAPQTGFELFTGNSANTLSQGVDMALHAVLLRRRLGWTANLLYNYSHNRVTKYLVSNGTNLNVVSANYANPLEGYPFYALFSFRYAGLDAEGDPQGYLDGELSKDYNAIMNSLDRSQLRYLGSAVPSSFGSLRNTISYKALELSFNISYKLGYYFRRSSLNNSSIYAIGGNGYQQADYDKRWQKSGDERHTNVPALRYPDDGYRTMLYTYSEALVEKGDHVRLQDLRLAWNMKHPRGLPFSTVQIYSYANNIGLLYRANKAGLDPDYPSGLPAVRTLAFGIRVSL